MSVWIALALIALCALLWDAGIVLQKSAVDSAPQLRLGRSSGASVLSLLRSRRWMAGPRQVKASSRHTVPSAGESAQPVV